jgi:hypothetical protein
MAIDFNRTKKTFPVISLPKSPIPAEDFGGRKGCCDEFLVLAGGENDWQNDANSAWIKLALITDDCSFILKNADGNNATYQPIKTQFPSDSLAFYATVEWSSVLAIDGAGCYTIEVNYIVSGVVGSFVWGQYDLKPYTVDHAKMTVRLKGVFNQINYIENINFTGSNVVDTLRFYGYFGKRQPNVAIDNLIYQNRVIENVQRENVNNYVLNSDPITSIYTDKLIDLYFLSESELYISEHSPTNHISQYKNLPVSISETAEIEYLDQSNLAKINVKLNDKIRNQLTKFM